MAKQLPTLIFLLSRREPNVPFGIRSKQHIAAYSTPEKAYKHMAEQRNDWQNIEFSTEYKIAVSGDIVDGYPEGLPYV